MTKNHRMVTVSNALDAVTEIREYGVRVFRHGVQFTLELDGQQQVTSSRVSAVVSTLADQDFARRIETAFGIPKPTMGRLRELFPRYDIIYLAPTDVSVRPTAQVLEATSILTPTK